MSVYTSHLRRTEVATSARPWIGALKNERDRVLTLMMFGALVTFELFNFSTTEYALKDLLGDLRLGTTQWATILALAFSAVDFAGVAWLFTPKKRSRVEAWYLIAAWLLAATMNATLTWWSVSLALLSNGSLGNEVISRETLLSGAPVFVALLIWLLRVLLIGSFTLAVRQPARDDPLDSAPLDLAQGRPLGRARGRRDELRSSTGIGETVPTPTDSPARNPARRALIAQPIRRR